MLICSENIFLQNDFTNSENAVWNESYSPIIAEYWKRGLWDLNEQQKTGWLFLSEH